MPVISKSARVALEERILASLALYPAGAAAVIYVLREFWDADAWTSLGRRKVAAAAASAFRDGRSCSVLELRARLEEDKDGSATLVKLTARGVADDASHAERLADELAGWCRVGRVQQALAETASRLKEDFEPAGFVTETQTLFSGLASAGVSIQIGEKAMTEQEQKYFDRKRQAGGAITGVRTGFQTLDYVTCGLQPGTVCIVGARPSHGKTVLGSCIGLNAAFFDHPLVFFSHEMGADDIYMRMTCQLGGISYRHLKLGRLRDTGEKKMIEAQKVIAGLPISVVDTGNMDPLRCRFAAQYILNGFRRRWKKTPIIVVDYIQLEHMPWYGGGKTNREQELTAISAAWMETAKQTGAALLILAQLNRSAAGAQPELHHLRESGALEQDASLVCLLWRPFKDKIGDEANYEPDRSDRRKAGANQAWLSIAKHRNGDLGEQALHFSGFNMAFRPWEDGDVPMSGSALRKDEFAQWAADSVVDDSSTLPSGEVRGGVDDRDVPEV